MVDVAGDADHPFSHGYLWPKGRALGEAHHRDDGFNDPAGSWAVRKLRLALGSEQAYSTYSIDSVPKFLVTTLMASTELLVPHPDDQGRLAEFVGSNPVVSHGQTTGFPNPVQWLRAARARGASSAERRGAASVARAWARSVGYTCPQYASREWSSTTECT